MHNKQTNNNPSVIEPAPIFTFQRLNTTESIKKIITAEVGNQDKATCITGLKELELSVQKTNGNIYDLALIELSFLQWLQIWGFMVVIDKESK